MRANSAALLHLSDQMVKPEAIIFYDQWTMAERANAAVHMWYIIV
jgi:hypothetical protein